MRHAWGPSQRTDRHQVSYEECTSCHAERFRGYWHYLRRPTRYGVTRKWRIPGPISTGPSCPGAKKGATP